MGADVRLVVLTGLSPLSDAMSLLHRLISYFHAVLQHELAWLRCSSTTNRMQERQIQPGGLFHRQTQHLTPSTGLRAPVKHFPEETSTMWQWSYFYSSPADQDRNGLFLCQTYWGEDSSHPRIRIVSLRSVLLRKPAKVGSGKLELAGWWDSRAIPQHCSLIVWCCWCKDRDRIKPV